LGKNATAGPGAFLLSMESKAKLLGFVLTRFLRAKRIRFA
jgi:hypothetical protein